MILYRSDHKPFRFNGILTYTKECDHDGERATMTRVRKGDDDDSNNPKSPNLLQYLSSKMSLSDIEGSYNVPRLSGVTCASHCYGNEVLIRLSDLFKYSIALICDKPVYHLCLLLLGWLLTFL